MERLKLGLTFVVIISLIGGGLYWISTSAERDQIETDTHLQRGLIYSKGVITEIHSYKGHRVEVTYEVNGRSYEYASNWDGNPQKLGVGDSITIKYAIDNPKFIRTELESGF